MWTLVWSRLGCHSRPLFLKLPSSSFFLQSTEMIGAPFCREVVHALAMWANCAYRSACDFPSMVFLLARKETPCAWSTSARADFLMGCPLAARAFTRWSNDFVVHCSRLMGSPLGSSSC